MEIEAEGIGKKFGKEWIFKNLSHSFKENSTIAVTGPNGSGKSTLLKVLSTYSPPTRGKLYFKSGGVLQENDHIQLKINYVAPYLNLVEELTFPELLHFHSSFKQATIGLKEILNETGLPEGKPIAEYSSGMKQRVKLSLGFFFESAALFLDEPTTNLDSDGVKWFHRHLENHVGKKMIIIASNIASEYVACDEILEISKFK